MQKLITQQIASQAIGEVAHLVTNKVADKGIIGALDSAVDYFAWRVAKHMIQQDKKMKENND